MGACVDEFVGMRANEDVSVVALDSRNEEVEQDGGSARVRKFGVVSNVPDMDLDALDFNVAVGAEPCAANFVTHFLIAVDVLPHMIATAPSESVFSGVDLF